MPEDITAAIDTARTAPLGAWAVAVCVTPDGRETFWLLSPDPDAEAGCACQHCAPHERLGPYVIDPSRQQRQEGHAP